MRNTKRGKFAALALSLAMVVAACGDEAAVAAVFAAEPGLSHEIAAGQIRVDRSRQ